MQIKKNGIKKKKIMRESVRVLLSVKAVFFFWVSENGWLDFFFSMKNRRKKKNIAGVFREKEMKKEKKR